jgi:hypothetical protein
MVVKNKSKEESLVDESVERAVFGKTRKMHRVEGRMRSLTFQWMSWVSKDPNREVATREKRLKKSRKKMRCCRFGSQSRSSIKYKANYRRHRS